MAVAPAGPDYNVDAEIANAPLDGGGAGGTVDPYDTSTWDVYLGDKRHPGSSKFGGKFLGDEAGYIPREYKRPVVMNTQEASIDHWYKMSQANRLAFAEKAFALGYISDPKDLTAAQKAWGDAVTNAAGFLKYQGKKVTPEQALEMYAGGTGTGKAKVQQKLGPDGKPLANRTIVQKHREVDLTRADQARAIVKQAFQTSVGRDPTDEEIRTLTRTLHAAELGASTKTTTKYDQYGDPIDVVNETTGGVTNPEQFVADQIEKDPEAAAYQGATTYFNSLMGMMGSPF